MFFYWILMSYAFVDILAVNLMTYIKEVGIANKLIENAYHMKVPSAFYNEFHIIIKNIVRENNYTFEEMNYMLAIPDYVPYEQLEDFRELQKRLQHEIIKVSGLSMPLAVEGQTCTQLGLSRRVIIREAIRGMFVYDLALQNDVQYTPVQKCHLIGMAIQARYLLNYTETAYVENSICIIKDSYGNVLMYQQFENEFWEVNCDFTKKEKLIEQLVGNAYLDSQIRSEPIFSKYTAMKPVK